MIETTVDSSGPDETRRFGESLGRHLQPGDILLLSGELGAGKTVFVQGLARGLGFDGPVSSRSFVLVGEYPGRLKLYHADLFRLDDPEQVDDLALGEISAGGVLAVEWPERGDWALPHEDIRIWFEVTSPETRRLHLSGEGDRARALLATLAEAG